MLSRITERTRVRRNQNQSELLKLVTKYSFSLSFLPLAHVIYFRKRPANASLTYSQTGALCRSS